MIDRLKLGLFNYIIFCLAEYLIYNGTDYFLVFSLCCVIPIIYLTVLFEVLVCYDDDYVQRSSELVLISIFPPFIIIFYYFMIKNYKTNNKHIIANFNIMQTLYMIEDNKEVCEDGLLCIIKDKLVQSTITGHLYPKPYEIYLIPDSITTYFKFNRWYKQCNKMKKKEEKIKTINENGSSEYYEILKQDLEKYKNKQEKKAFSLIKEAQNNFEKILSE